MLEQLGYFLFKKLLTSVSVVDPDSTGSFPQTFSERKLIDTQLADFLPVNVSHTLVPSVERIFGREKLLDSQFPQLKLINGVQTVIVYFYAV